MSLFISCQSNYITVLLAERLRFQRSPLPVSFTNSKGQLQACTSRKKLTDKYMQAIIFQCSNKSQLYSGLCIICCQLILDTCMHHIWSMYFEYMGVLYGYAGEQTKCFSCSLFFLLAIQELSTVKSLLAQILFSPTGTCMYTLFHIFS